jgi:uncharacterized RDD family membrane protein YckC
MQQDGSTIALNTIANNVAALPTRALALCIDAVILAPAPIIGTWISLNYSDRAFVAACQSCITVVVLAYWILSHGLYGQSVGKKLCGLVVLDISGSKVSMKQAVLRASPGIAFLLLRTAITVYLIHTGSDTIDPRHGFVIETVLRRASDIFGIAEIVAVLTTQNRRA